MVNDGLWHTIELLTVKQNFTLRIDHGTARFIVNNGVNEYLQTTSPLYIGGLPREVAEEAVKRWHLRDTGSFNGKLGHVWDHNALGGQPACLGTFNYSPDIFFLYIQSNIPMRCETVN